jgi:hypothetical protein
MLSFKNFMSLVIDDITARANYLKQSLSFLTKEFKNEVFLVA